ncbi:bifunctional 4-hydroxy-2-oxoglutarate aldolase/2-dehydro-3-deoxy-phosphogluconate aldolase [Tetragenococcus halophilus]|nr:bifunctional 4-hydroxy-2-oxoglutarate aldolase/2-dehydro-3-deoxy-phosphogluconate aldolase [Atopostipes sp.]MDN6733310.1 bifunctional 4-hydroxy-2-oxoglutarate aldolase/2-dehydro-3-deoxy-phosphogluconate aldolase [Tetragenococcus koreensis]MDN6735842.1 bifunctional 4-hydroxy-2-oxoglutarate aldolase/2-dehydro-3-deoxy-phosphogluconate aldolase [Tetragenococcus koreensis]QXN87368.1 bifunctional 4-hydroxy-2-oxoglutarate aldolase/2-dehydro-3-deoxy-phosphogluconate aldolase [Tetragenococcus halophil
MTNLVKEYIEKNKIIAIVRGTYGKELINLVSALEKGGVKLVEVTFDQSDPECLMKTSEAITILVEKFAGKMKIGAGTVLNEEQVETAHRAGAEYIISPNTNQQVIKKTKELKLVSIPGALTPSEILEAHEMGADFVKIFPAGAHDLKYIKDIRGPINHIKILATAGVTPDNLEDYLNVGFSGAGISGYLTDKKLITAGKFEMLTEHAKELMAIASDFDKGK